MMGDQLTMRAGRLLCSSAEDVRSPRSPDTFSIFVPSPVLPVRRPPSGHGKRASREKVIYPRRLTTISGSPPFTGGAQLTKQVAMKLRQAVFGAPLSPPRQEWLSGGFRFQPPGSGVGYGLQTPQPLTQPLLMAVQTHVIKHLLFQRPLDACDMDSLLRPRHSNQQASLASALSDILWQSRAAAACHVCLCTEALQIWGDTDYLPDNVTERVQYWSFCQKDDLRDFITTYIKEFESLEGSGCLLLLYSLVLTRGISRISDDLGGVQPALLTLTGGVTHALTNLVLTGQATPFLHNGTIWETLEDDTKRPLRGVAERSEVGLLLQEEPSRDCPAPAAGSRLKTPLLPIWLTCCHGLYGVLFHLNRELTRDYHAEHRFDLHYYSGREEQHDRPTLITVDTKSRPAEHEEPRPPLDDVILSKWPEAAIDWHGTTPYL